MFQDHYTCWTISRMNGIRKYAKEGFFAGKTVLELGCGYAHVGNEFYGLGGCVTSCDARTEHLSKANIIYPHIRTFVYDGDKDTIDESYDVIIHWGLLYHLGSIEIGRAHV